jgi:cytochrome b involved in lipid metabolism
LQQGIGIAQKNSVRCEESSMQDVGAFKPGLPVYTEQQVQQHNTVVNRVWATYKNGVYDITDLIANHPGRMFAINESRNLFKFLISFLVLIFFNL